MKISEITVVDENAAVASAAAPAAKGLGRFLPGLGLAASGYDAYNRYKRGDYTGAALAGASGLASFIPGIGTAASLGLTAANAMRDKQRTGSYFPGDEELDAANKPAQMTPIDQPAAQQPAQQPAAQQPAAQQLPPGADPKTYALQQQLIAKGAKISLDGKMGPQTQAAMKQFGMAENIKEQTMTNAEKMAAMRDKLKLLESRVDEGPMDFLKGAWNVGKNFVGGVGGKAVQGTAKTAAQLAASQAATNAARVAAGKKALSAAQLAQQAKAGIGTTNAATSAAKFANKAGQVIAKNPGKTALAGTALGAGAGYLAGKPGQQPPTPTPGETPAAPTPGTATKPAAQKPGGTAAKPAAPAAGGEKLNPQEEQELALLANELGAYMGKSPQVDALLLKHQKLRGEIPQP
jgi:hypothetical protein